MDSAGPESPKARGQGFQDLEIWQDARSLASHIYSITQAFPDSEPFGLTSQIRRAAVSVASNIAEGHGRRSSGSFVQFLHVAIGSLSEVQSLLFLAEDFGFIVSEEAESTRMTCNKLSVRISNLVTHLRSKQKT